MPRTGLFSSLVEAPLWGGVEFLLGTGLLSSPVEAPLSGGVEFLPRTGLFSSPVEAPLGWPPLEDDLPGPLSIGQEQENLLSWATGRGFVRAL